MCVLLLTYHGAAERPEPPHQQQSQEQEDHQQGYEHDGAVKLGKSSGDKSKRGSREAGAKEKKVKRKKLVYSQPPLVDRHNRGDLRERGEKTEERKRNCVKEQQSGPVDLSSSTHAFSRGDVNRAGDVGDALVHAHLHVDHPAKQPNITHTQTLTHTPDRSSAG